MNKKNRIESDAITLTENAAKRVHAIITGEKKEGFFFKSISIRWWMLRYVI